MPSIEQKIEELEDEIRNTQYNKATQHHIGKLKAKIARLKEDAAQRDREGIGVGGRKYMVKKTGHASVALIGFPSAGKSTLLNRLTNAESEVGSYHFTTLSIVPGILEYKCAQIQILDLPGLIRGASHGKGRGREVLGAARNADLCLILLDVFNTNIDALLSELRKSGIRLNERPPDINMSTSDRGGVVVNSTVEQTHIDEDLIKSILKEYGIVNANLVLRDDIDEDQLIDFLAGNRIYSRMIVVVNKVDLVDDRTLDAVLDDIGDSDPICISAEAGTGIERLKEKIFDALNFIRVYLKPQGEDADMEEPLVVQNGSTVGAVCDILHRDFQRKFRYARVWGPSGKFPGQNVGLDHELADRDVLSIIIRR